MPGKGPIHIYCNEPFAMSCETAPECPARRHPFLFGVAMSAIKTSASDFMAQTVVEQREQAQHPF